MEVGKKEIGKKEIGCIHSDTIRQLVSNMNYLGLSKEQVISILPDKNGNHHCIYEK